LGEDVELLVSHEATAEEEEAYEQPLTDAMMGEPFHFARQDYVELVWRIVDPVLQAMPPVIEYEPGTWGAREAAVPVAPDAWHDPVVQAAARRETP
jgi:glucose-6-phosphate 1-dehydrogenase